MVKVIDYMRDYLVLVIKGFIIGIANIIPGVSGGTLAITLGIYEKLINAVSHFISNIKENLKLIIPILVGAILSLAILSNVISYALEHFKVPTTLFFLGLIVGGLPLIYKKVDKSINASNILIIIITFALVVSFTFLDSGNTVISFKTMDTFKYISLLFIGMIAAATMVIPGISGSFVLMMLGYYEPIINTIKDLTHFMNIGHNMLILIPFGIGILIGIVLIAKTIEFLLSKHEEKTYFGIIGFVLASIVSILINMGLTNNMGFIVCGIILFILGFGIAYRLGEK